jgi:hypothetical protein
MANTLRIKRRPVGGAAGAPAALAAAELAFNEQDDTLYYGKGNSGGSATSIVPIAGSGYFLPLTGGTLTGNLTISSAGALVVQSTTASTSPITGALTVAGGLGVGGAINASSDITSYRAATPTTGAYFFGNTTQKYLYFDGTKFQFSNDPVNIFNATASTSPSTGALTVNGGLGVGGAINATNFIAISPTQSRIRFANAAGGSTGFVMGRSLNNDNANDFFIYDTTAVAIRLTIDTAGAVSIPGALNPAGINIKPASGDAVLTFYKGGTLQSYISDNGNAIWVYSNASATQGMYILHGASAWTAVSDARLPYKQTAQALSVLDKLEYIQLYENEVNGRLELFGKAQELYHAFPHVVVKGDDDPNYIPTGELNDKKAWGIAYDRLGLVALQAVKELLAHVQRLETRIQTLEQAAKG